MGPSAPEPKAYAYREVSFCCPPRYVLEALDEPWHITQGRVIVFAATKKAACERLAELGWRTHERELAVSRSAHAQALRVHFKDSGLDGEVFAMPLNGYEVAHLRAEGEAVLVGRIDNGVYVSAGEVRNGGW